MKLQTVINVAYTQLANSVVITEGKRYNYLDGKYSCWMQVPPHVMLEYLSAKDSSRITYAAACKVKPKSRDFKFASDRIGC